VNIENDPGATTTAGSARKSGTSAVNAPLAATVVEATVVQVNGTLRPPTGESRRRARSSKALTMTLAS